MANLLTSTDLSKKIKWYIRAHGHSSIGGMNVIWTFLKYNNHEKITAQAEKIISLFENFDKASDFKSYLNSLELEINDFEKEISSLHLADEKKTELGKILEGVRANLVRISSIIETPDYEEYFNMVDVLHSAITEIIAQYPFRISGNLIDNQAGDITIHFKEKNTPRQILLCGYEFQLLFYNLLSNAVDAVREVKEKGEIWVEFEYLDDQFKFSVIDDGAPIAEENILKILRRESFTTKGRKHGKGTQIIYDIIDKYKMNMDIVSNNWKTEFIFSLAPSYKS